MSRLDFALALLTESNAGIAMEMLAGINPSLGFLHDPAY